MHDIKFIREQPDLFQQKMIDRGLADFSVETILALDEQRRNAQTKMQTLLNERNQHSKEIGMKKAKGGDADDLIAKVANLKDEIQTLEMAEEKAASALREFLISLPNIAMDHVPVGTDETANQLVREWGEPSPHLQDVDVKAHYELGEALGLLDFETAAKMSGARFSFLMGDLARLERALANFMLDVHTTENGYLEALPPFLVRDEAMFGTGQLPKFSEDLFQTTVGSWLIPTAEVPLTNSAREHIFDEADLPRRLTAWTPCFRSEAGAAGRDTRGMIRQHQFSKVELVSLVAPDQSQSELERMTNCAEMILKYLELPYRVMRLSTGDMGFGARETFDIEVWLPAQNQYREISSCSNCGDFQARRMEARMRNPHAKGTQFIHTLNGSGLAVGRTLVAVLENYQQEDGSVQIPHALIPYMGGKTKIEALT